MFTNPTCVKCHKNAIFKLNWKYTAVMASQYHLESYKNQGRKAVGHLSFVIWMFQCTKEKQKVQMKFSGHVRIISATRASKFFSGKLQESPTICNSTLPKFMQGRMVRVKVFHNSLAIGQYWLAQNFTICFILESLLRQTNKVLRNEKTKSSESGTQLTNKCV